MEEVKLQLLSRGNQTEMATYCMIPTMCYTEKGKTGEEVEISEVVWVLN